MWFVRKWLVDTVSVPVLEEQYFIAQAPGQISARMLGGKSKNYFTKTKISHNPEVRFYWEASKMEIIMPACDPESKRSGKNLQPENDLLELFGMTSLSRVFVRSLAVLDVFAISRFALKYNGLWTMHCLRKHFDKASETPNGKSSWRRDAYIMLKNTQKRHEGAQ